MGMALVWTCLVTATAVTGQREPKFTDVSADTGMWSVPTAWGITIEDVNGDGRLDLLMANNGSENALFLNEGNLRFRGQPIIGGAPPTEALVPGDVDLDGHLDLLACAWGGAWTLLRGDGKGRFTEVSEPWGLPNKEDARCGGAALGDLDADGDLDLYLPESGGEDAVLTNEDGVFTDVSARMRLVKVPRSESALMADFTDDGRLDIYVPRYDGRTALLVNRPEGTLDDLASETAVFSSPLQVGACAFDADNDGDLDLLCVAGRFTGEGAPLRLLINQGEGTFEDATPAEWQAEWLNYHTACAGDVDNDGDLDVFASAQQGCRLWMNEGQGKFARAVNDPGWGQLQGVGALLCDLDSDGDLDAIVRSRKPNAERSEFLFRNDLNNSNWLQVRPISAEGSRFCAGAQVRLYRAGGLGDPARLLARQDLTGLRGWCSYGPFVAHFGVKEGSEYDVEVRFTNGLVAIASNLRSGQYVELQAQR